MLVHILNSTAKVVEVEGMDTAVGTMYALLYYDWLISEF
jgi:DNA-binding transcriptional regulator GbsR (MarR family)